MKALIESDFVRMYLPEIVPNLRTHRFWFYHRDECETFNWQLQKLTYFLSFLKNSFWSQSDSSMLRPKRCCRDAQMSRIWFSEGTGKIKEPFKSTESNYTFNSTETRLKPKFSIKPNLHFSISTKYVTLCSLHTLVAGAITSCLLLAISGLAGLGAKKPSNSADTSSHIFITVCRVCSADGSSFPKTLHM